MAQPPSIEKAEPLSPRRPEPQTVDDFSHLLGQWIPSCAGMTALRKQLHLGMTPAGATALWGCPFC